jgi:antitoxin component YwqK of YwqJK toxin-antitoxin module
MMEPYVSPGSEFDPYYKWLGIPPQYRPPDHYRLLGLEAFESDREVIRAAAERQAAYLQNYKIGPQSELSQRLLNEVSKAKVCLLDPAKKSKYDHAIRTAAMPPLGEVPAAPPYAASAPAHPDAISPVARLPSDSEETSPQSGSSVPTVQLRTVIRRKQRNTWTPFVLVGLVAITVSGIAIVALRGTTPVARNAVIEPDKQIAPRPKLSDPLSISPPLSQRPPRPKPNAKTAERIQQPSLPSQSPGPGTKLPVPTFDEQATARTKIDITGDPTPSQLLELVTPDTHAWQRYLIYRMAIDAAIKDRNRTVAELALERLQAEFDVEGATAEETRQRIAAIQAKPNSFRRSSSSPSRTFLTTPSGTNWPLEPKPATVSILRNLFPDKAPSVFVLRLNRSPIGLFGYAKSKFDGPAIVLYPDGHPKMLLNFTEHSRDGLLHHWNQDGELQFSATYKNGRKLGLCVIYQNGLPHLIEEWGTSQTPTRYLVENPQTDARLVELEAVAAKKDAHSKTIARMAQMEQDLFREEGEWKREFSEWWRRHDNEIKKLERAKSLGGTKWEKKLSEYYASIQIETQQGRESLLSLFIEPTAGKPSGTDLQTGRSGQVR